jgi:hypothetical protein
VASSISAGIPWLVDGPPLDAGVPFRTYDVGTRSNDVGTATAVQVPAGVYPGLGAMAVTAASGLSIQVAAGYCTIPSPTTGQGGYLFGTLTAQTLTLAAADPGNPRIDLVVAWVNDTGTSSGGCGIAVVTGTPATPPAVPSSSSIPVPSTAVLVLAQVTVPPAAVALASGAITDERSFVVAPGGVLPITSPSAAPAAPPSQLMYDLSRNVLVQGTGTAGTVALLGGAWAPAIAFKKTTVSDSAAKGVLTQVLSVSVTTDGATDVEVYAKWPGLYVSAAPLIVTMSVSIDGAVLDQSPIYVQSATSTAPANGGSFRAYTSASNGTTPAFGTHTVAFTFQSASTSSTTTLACSSTAQGVLRVSPAIA